MEMALARDQIDISKLQIQEYGSLFLANLVESYVGASEIINSVAEEEENGKSPSIGEYFLFSVFNRMIEPRSKEALSKWYKNFAVHWIRPIDVDALNSRMYWKKWDNLSSEQLQKIAYLFFHKVNSLVPLESDCLLFDTTNYFTYMDSKTSSELAARGKNKDGKHWLRQIGLALLLPRDTGIPLFYREYEGNCHDSKLFTRLLEEMHSAMKELSGQDRELTLVFDKGMNSEVNIENIDINEDLHFITSYSPYFAKDLAEKDPGTFTPVDTAPNRELVRQGKEEEQIVAYRTSREFWGKERTVVVSYNPRTASKQRYSFEKKLLTLQQQLFEMRSKVNAQKPHWREASKIEKRYNDLCDKLYLPKDLYDLELAKENGRLRMRFRKNHYKINKYISKLGKNIIVTSHHDWSTDDIVRASLDRYIVEHAFRQTKSSEFANMRPIWHWTDQKISCHILCCVIALTYLRLISLWLQRAGVDMTPDQVMQNMRTLGSCLLWHSGKRKPVRIIEDPTPEQASILKVFGYEIASGVSQKLAS
jgi:transposase